MVNYRRDSQDEQAPDYPDDTCPFIDEAQQELRNIGNNLLEDLRTANSSLRTWGYWWQKKAKAYKAEAKGYEESNERLSARIQELEQQIKDLTNPREVLRQHYDRILQGLPESILLSPQEGVGSSGEINGSDLRGSLARCDGRGVEEDCGGKETFHHSI